ncbi:sigma-70 family RNA polymerase sigma factor [Microbacterium hominis]|uniref:sigma-70 family RNA polymerase sigma factor n=1 Tax=Microbacterium TaxID=33882 RepID=UPI00168A6840|nr:MULTISPECIES: sigma-70 family RNA polymerase sigma factor [Microbacterium]QOC26744.1 sigma-70 family RNA polymerase sigma factor [Microbacterium hominis]QOC27920.1 sigma-70 family RNA polymerase sigma factor [Microbacterium hominis]QYF96928.1 sigma-70 family RNA polymerase sigma factor [Microbacterium sp. PAMC21962]
MHEHDDDLTAAAASGDAAAAAEFFARNLRMLHAIAHRVSGGLVDPDDLVSEAITSVLDRWRRGLGPREGVVGYIVQSMRNRVIDEARSPRSRTSALPGEEVLVAAASPEIERVELHREAGYVVAALASLSADHQAILKATILDGRKPGDLVDELGRPAAAIHSLNRRAKLALRRATLSIMLAEDAPPDCRRAASTLPSAIADRVEDTADAAAMDHIRSCDRCRRVWIRFAALRGAFGIAGLLVLADTTGLIRPAAASADDRVVQDDAAPGPGVGVDGRAAPRGAWARNAPTVIKATGAVTAAAGAVLLGGFVASSLSPSATSGDTAGAPDAGGPSAELVVESVAAGDGTGMIHLRLDLDDDTGSQLNLTVSVPSGISFASLPDQWSCDIEDSADREVLRCTTSGSTDGRIGLHDRRTAAEGTYRLEVEATTSVGMTGVRGSITGTATGALTPTVHVARARLGEISRTDIR